MIDTLKATMASQTNGYIAIIDGVMNPMTFGQTKNDSGRAALIVKTKHFVLRCCDDPNCEAMVNVLADQFPDVKIVPVDVTERKA